MRRETPSQELKRLQAEGKPPIQWGEYIAVEKRCGATGDKVVERVLKVTKLTPTQVVAGRNERFYRADGRSIEPAFLSRPNARPATKEEYDAYVKKQQEEQARRDEQKRKVDEIENSPENKLVSAILNDWEPERRPQLRALGEQQLRIALDLLTTKRSQLTLDMLQAVLDTAAK